MNRQQQARGAARDRLPIVLDKSFVRTASGKQVRAVCDQYQALMTEELFFELTHDDQKTRALSFAKFPSADNPVGLLPPVGMLIQFENTNRRPVSPLWDHRLDAIYNFNPGLASGNHEMTRLQLSTVRKWEEDLTTKAESFAKRAKLIVKIFPVLRGHLPGQDRAPIEELRHDVACNIEGVRSFYKAVAPKDFPPASIVGRTWAVFRYIQVHLIADVELFSKYGMNVNVPSMAKLENERADLDYLVVALLARG